MYHIGFHSIKGIGPLLLRFFWSLIWASSKDFGGLDVGQSQALGFKGLRVWGFGVLGFRVQGFGVISG